LAVPEEAPGMPRASFTVGVGFAEVAVTARDFATPLELKVAGLFLQTSAVIRSHDPPIETLSHMQILTACPRSHIS
jgi:hypothetical protein